MPFLKVALANAPKQLFDYLAPQTLDIHTLTPGIRVLVPFGHQKRVGILVSTIAHSDYPVNKLKEIIAIIDKKPILTNSVLKICLWLADYYCTGTGNALFAALPVQLRQGSPLPNNYKVFWQLTADSITIEKSVMKHATKQQQLLALFETVDEIEASALKNQGIQKQTLAALEKKNIISQFKKTSLSIPFFEESYFKNTLEDVLAEEPLALNQEQQSAIDLVSPAIEICKKFQVTLLHGITGSGKTEVYLQLIHKTLKAGRQALVLVPEIGLAPQMITRFQQRFKIPVALSHSGLNNTERLDAWLTMRSGEAGILIGTRSAVFSPLLCPGIIIIDEEHDTSYKQAEGLRYSARDLAIYRGKIESIPVVLGSATPSLESYHNAQIQRYQYTSLKERAGKANLPVLHLIDTRHQVLEGGLSHRSLTVIQHALQQKEQVLVFINRRGFAPSLLCNDCGYVMSCPHCDSTLTLHKIPPHLSCHHCEYKLTIPNKCPHCHSENQTTAGAGSEQCEQVLNQYFSDYPILRIDRDSTSKKNALKQLLALVNEQKPCILVGTQMLAKGHHFPAVTQVIIINADAGFFSADFRGIEKTIQLIQQVSGRAGRGEKSGNVFIQTSNPESLYLNQLINGQQQFLIDEILDSRRQLKLPPFGFIALFSAQSRESDKAHNFLKKIRFYADQTIKKNIQLSLNVAIVGPMPAPLEKKQGKYRFQLMVRSDTRKPLHQLFKTLNLYAESLKSNHSIRWFIDIDPQEFH